MPIGIIDNFNVNTGKAIDSREGPYATTAEALAAINSNFRYLGQTVVITGSGDSIEYWFKTDTTNLVLKTGGSVSGANLTFQKTGSLLKLMSGSVELSSVDVTASLAYTASFITASNVWGPFGTSSVQSASYASSSTYALTASYVANAGGGTPGGSNGQIQFNSASVFSGSSTFYISSLDGPSGQPNAYDHVHLDRTWLTVTDNNNLPVLQIEGTLLLSSSGVGSIDWGTRRMYDALGSASIDYDLRQAYYPGDQSVSPSTAIDWGTADQVRLSGSIFTPDLTNVSQINAVVIDTASGQLYYLPTSSLGGGSGTPGGSNTQIQFNSASIFSGSSNLTFDYSSSINVLTLTGSLKITGSTTQIGNNTLLGNTLLSGSIIISGSNPPGNLTASVQVYGDIETYGYHRFDPVTTNIDTSISASYIYVSGSTQDLYFSQNGSGYNNVTRLRWLESTLYTGVLKGGVLSSTPGSTQFSVTGGEGIIVSINAALDRDPYPTLKVVNWSTQTLPITYSGSAKITYVGIDNTGTVIQQTVPWGTNNIDQWDNSISLGVVLHLSGSVSTGVFNAPQIAYGPSQKQDDFFRAFGPLKVSGHTLLPSGSTLGLKKLGGTSYREGANYVIDPNHPSTVVEGDITTSKIYRYYLSGSTPVIDTGIANAGYTFIDPTQYVNTATGQLTTVFGNNSNQWKWTIQRVFWVPNSPTNAFIVYYGNAEYATLIDVKNAIDTEPFSEAPNTAQNAIFIGYILVRKGCTDLSDTTGTNAVLVQGGLFRNVGGNGGSGTSAATTLSSLSDVTITSPSYGDLLMYDTTVWNNTKTLSGSYTLSGSLNVSGSITGSLFGTASFASTASFVPNAFIQNGNSFETTAILGTNDEHNLVFETSGSTRMFISSSGEVGIGVASPSASLHVSGTVILNSSGAFSQPFNSLTDVPVQIAGNTGIRGNNLYLYPTAGASITASFIYGYAGVAAWLLRSQGTEDFRLNSGSTVMWNMSQTGLGIFKTSPNAALDVFGSTNITGSLAVSESVFFPNLVTSSTAISNVVMYGASGQLFVTASSAIGGSDVFPYTGSAIISGSLTITGSLYVSGAIQSGGSGHLVTYNTSSGLFSYTASSAVGGGGPSTFNSTSSIVGDGATKTFDVVHNYNTRNLHVTVYENGNNYDTVYADVRRPDENTVRVTFAIAPNTLQFVIYVSQ